MEDGETGPLTQGQLVGGRYEVGTILGRGGMGWVYAALDRELGREVALKVLGSPHWQDTMAVERFLRQARAMARVEHRGVVRVYDRALHDGRIPYVVMERLVGRDLRALLREAGRCSVGRALAWSIELCEALQAVHAQSIVHRDLKPSNVFVAQLGTYEQLKLLDFGIAKLQDEPPLTATQELLGTFAYMSPEQLDQREVGVQSDVYAIACILYELLAGRAPFRARSRAELVRAIVHDPPQPLAAFVPGISPALERCVLQNLSKHASDRAPSAQQLADTLRALRVGARETESVLPRVSSGADAVVAGRYQLLHKLGEGSSGVVYAARDRSHGGVVALKRLRSVQAEDVYRLKREFRTLVDLAHPNLVRRFELSCDPGEAFFTMELIQGKPLQARLAEAPEQLRALLCQLANGLAALHTRQLVHRDLKPSNVLVDGQDRLVLLDFGLTVPDSSHSWIAGTPRYMAPESREGAIGPAADMYAFGVILHELLTGEAPPPSGELPDAISGPGSEFWPTCRALLARDPAARPSAEQLISLLASPLTAAWSGVLPEENSSTGGGFVGRSHELAQLRAALAETADGGPRLVVLRGESGIGKSALLARLSLELGQTALLLASCCRDSESLPYPALDAAIDALADHLAARLRSSLTPLLPRHIAALAQLFPVLQRIEALQPGNHPRELPRDPAEIRTRAYAALQRLLQRLCEERPVVLLIDDAHWIDPDSAALLAYLLNRPDPPALLVVLAVRADHEHAANYRALVGGLNVPARTLTVAALPAPEGRALVQAWLHDSGAPAVVERIVAQCAGHPLMLSVLAQHARSGSAADPQLTEALELRSKVADPAAERLLELTCLCQRPLPIALLLAAAGGGEPELARVLCRLRLARRVLVAGEPAIEPYHVRIREVVLSGMQELARRAGHAALAGALASAAERWPEALAEHLFASGDKLSGARVATQAAHVAERQLAFDRAAALYEVALRESQPEPAQRLTWLLGRATALRNAGRSVEAAEALCEASRVPGDEYAADHLRSAGELLLFAGERERGLALLVPLLERAGLSLPADANEALQVGMAAFEELGARGLRRAAPGPLEAGREAALRERFELSLTIANGLAAIDSRGLPFAIRALLEAFALDQPAALQRALSSFVTLTAGLFFNPHIAPALALCRELTLQLDTPEARARLFAAEGEAEHYSGNFLLAEAAFDQAERILLESCTSMSRELASVRNGIVLMEYAQKGDFQSQLERTLSWQADAQARRDTFHDNVLRIAHSIVWIAQDDPAKARRELARAAHAWKDGAGAYEVGMLEYCDVIDRYEGRSDVHLRPLQGRDDMVNSPAAASSFLAGYIHLQRAWGAIRALAAGSTAERALAEAAIAALRALNVEIWSAVADAFQANLEFLAAKREHALSLLQRAESTFRKLHMRCLAACARFRHGELSGGEFGARLVSEARAELLQLGVRRPERWTRAYFSVFDREDTGELTLITQAPL